MGARVVLDIVPRRIEPADWAEAYDEARTLLLAHPARLLGYDWRTVAGVPLPVYTRAVERDRDDPGARRWCVAGERASLAMGEPQTMYRDLGRYLASTAHEAPCPALDDVLFAVAVDAEGAGSEAAGRALPAHPVPVSTRWPHASPAPHGRSVARPGGGLARVLGGAGPGAACGLPLLAAAMIVEARFPRWAMVHGEVDRDQADAARRWAEGVLGRPIALPVRVDAWRLVERLGARFEGQALVRAVDALHLGVGEKRDATLLGLFGRAQAESWWLGKLRAHARPDEAGALRLMAAHLDATRDVGRLCGLACLDARGPRYAPEALMTALATLRARPGGLGRVDDAAIEQALALVFGAGAARLMEVLRRREDAKEPPEVPAASGGAADLEALATLPSPGDLTALQREHVHALALVAGGLQADERAPAAGGAALQALATLLARSGPTLTEDAWDWIAREDDADLMRFLAALAALDDPGAELALVRRALFENRALCRYALGARRDAG
jgi:hypothetical protein